MKINNFTMTLHEVHTPLTLKRTNLMSYVLYSSFSKNRGRDLSNSLEDMS